MNLREEINRCFALFDRGDLAAAKRGYLACMDAIKDKTTEEYSSVLMGLGYVASALGKHQEAREYTLELLALAKDTEARHTALHQLGMVERVAGEYDKALSCFHQEKQLILQHFPHDILKRAANAYELAYLRFLKKEADEALPLMRLALGDAQASGDMICIGCAWRGLGQIHAARGETALARSAFLEAKASFMAGGDEIGGREADEILATLPDESSQAE